jgi:putative inorganic carbon (HCO3(-)) transporter
LRQLSPILRSRVILVLLYCLFLWGLASSLVSALSTRISVPNLAQVFAPTIAMGAAFLGYWFYMTQAGVNGLDISFGRPRLSVRLLVPLLFACSVGAALMTLEGNRFPGAAGAMVSLLFIVGLIAALVLPALRPHLGVSAILLALPFAFTLHLIRRYQDETNLLGYIAINPDTLLILVGSFALLLGLLAWRKGVVRTGMDIPIGIFLLGSLISLVFSPNLLISARVVFVGTVVPILFYYLVVNGVRTRRELILAVTALMVSLLLMAGYSLMAFERDTPTGGLLSGEERLSQFFHNTTFFAIFLTLLLPLPLCLTTVSQMSYRVRIASGILFAIMLVALVFTYTRGAWVGFAVSMVALLLFSTETRRLLLRISPLLVGAFLIWSGIATQILWTRTYSLEAFFQSGSWLDRVETWQAAWQMIVHNPITGIGPGLYRYFYPEYQVNYNAILLLIGGQNSHNLILNVWAEMGLLAGVGLTGFLASSLRTGYRLIRGGNDPLLKAISMGLFAGLVGFVVGSSFGGTLLVHRTLDELTLSGGHTLYLFLVPALLSVMSRIVREEKLQPEVGGDSKPMGKLSSLKG